MKKGDLVKFKKSPPRDDLPNIYLVEDVGNISPTGRFYSNSYVWLRFLDPLGPIYPSLGWGEAYLEKL